MVQHEADTQKRRRARRIAREIMARVARDNSLACVTYEDIADRIAAAPAHRYAPNGPAFTDLLCDISRATLKEGKGLLSSVVVRKDSGMPGDGFFILLDELGRLDQAPETMTVDERRTAWSAERRLVDEEWRGRR